MWAEVRARTSLGVSREARSWGRGGRAASWGTRADSQGEVCWGVAWGPDRRSRRRRSRERRREGREKTVRSSWSRREVSRRM